MLKPLTLAFLIAVLLAVRAPAAEPKVPLIHSTDLLHPYNDPDDHYDLATVFALDEFDVRAVVLDLGDAQLGRPGRVPLEQMMHITKRKVPYATGMLRQLHSTDDKAQEQDAKFDAGIQLVLSTLRASKEKVVLHTGGSCKDVAVAFNRDPKLLKDKVKAIFIDIGIGPGGIQNEWNVMYDPFSFCRLWESGLPIYWCPCAGKDGYQTYYLADEVDTVNACPKELRNFFIYCLTKSTADPIAFLKGPPQPAPPKNGRSMWCTAGLLHAAGRKIYQRGNDDFVALTPAAAEKAGLAGKAVEVFQFVPIRAKIERMYQPPAQAGKEPVWPILATEVNAPGATNYIFRVTSPRYQAVLASVLKNLLSGLGR